tara:strand:+ start:811 stop:1077 length:267 start_codon:yes stop_codon:yes gene_type:complete
MTAINVEVSKQIAKSLNEILSVAEKRKLKSHVVMGFVCFTILNSAFETNEDLGNDVLHRVLANLEHQGRIKGATDEDDTDTDKNRTLN